MRVLLDTHALLWWLFDDPKLPDRARRAIGDPANTVLVSSASAWEIATKHRLGRLPEAGDVAHRLPEYVRRGRLVEAPITTDDALEAGSLPGPHRDPFDRMLIAQARNGSVPVVTNDQTFRDYGVAVVW
ncbi:MAG: type II toxin-antitoxin system VapC family toxin [Acidimicrobiia bacterium]